MTTVATLGIFDYELHPGHIQLLQYCASLGDKLIVFLVDDVTATRIKRKPYYNQYQRMDNLTEYADEIILLTGTDHIDTICKSSVDKYVLGPDQNRPFDQIIISKLECEIIQLEKSFDKTFSTTKLLEEIGYLKKSYTITQKQVKIIDK